MDYVNEENEIKDGIEKKCEEDKRYLRRRRIISILSFIGFLGVTVCIALTLGNQLLSLVSDPKQFQLWVQQQGIWGRLMLVGIMCMQVVISVMPGEVVEIAAGYAFGTFEGMALCLLGAAAASTVVFLVVRLFGVKLVEAFVSREKINSLSFIRNAKRLNLLVFLLFFIPGSPKDILTYVIGITPMKLPVFLLITTVARVPSVITSTIGGEALGAQNYTFAIIVFAATAVISLLGILVYRRLIKRQKEEEAAAESEINEAVEEQSL